MQSLLKFESFIKELNQSNSRKYKIEVLSKYKDDETIKYLLNFIYNPYIVTGISEAKYLKDLKGKAFDLAVWGPLFDILDYIKNHNTGTDQIIFTLQAWEDLTLGDKPEELRTLFKKIVTKSLSLGIDVLTINKCIPNLIPTFNVMLANKYFEKPEYVEGKEFAITTKIDGGRIIAIKKGDDVSFYTRAGQRYEGLIDLEEELKQLPFDVCLDGEITLLDPWVIDGENDLWSEDHLIGRKLTSKEQYKETMKITRRDGEKHGVKMLVFDFMPPEDFEKQISHQTYKERRAWLEKLPKMTFFEVLPILYQGNDTNEITKWLNYNIEHGEEGIMINIVNSLYEFKRTNNLLKVKKMNDIDLPILDFEEGTGKNKGKLGALITEYKGFMLKVGSGFTDELREKIWNNKEEYRGLTMSVQYFEETTNQEGGISLRFPVFLDFRYDK